MTARMIDISGIEPVESSAASSPKPDLAWVKIRSLVIDDRYQRDLGPKNISVIRRIAADFDWAMFTPVTVSIMRGPRPGREKFVLIDGQHRVHAAALAGLRLVPALIVDIPPEKQAAAFAGINSQRTAVTPINMFKAALMAGEQWAVEAEAAVREAGCRLMTYNKSAAQRKPREIFAVGLIRDHVVAGRSHVVTAGLRGIASSSRGDDTRLYAVRVARPWLAALAQEEEFIDKDIAAFVSEVDLVSLIDRAQIDRPRGSVASGYQLALGAIRAAIVAFIQGNAADRPAARAAGLATGGRTRRWSHGCQAGTDAAGQRQHGQWSEERDQRLMESGGRYRELTALAEEWGLSFREVQARWHLVRRAA